MGGQLAWINYMSLEFPLNSVAIATGPLVHGTPASEPQISGLNILGWLSIVKSSAYPYHSQKEGSARWELSFLLNLFSYIGFFLLTNPKSKIPLTIEKTLRRRVQVYLKSHASKRGKNMMRRWFRSWWWSHWRREPEVTNKNW